MEETRDIDRQTRRLLQALGQTLREHLGTHAANPRFLAELYRRLRESLAGDQGARGATNGSPWDRQKLALDVYLVAATHLEGDAATPAFLSEVKKRIDEALV